MHSLIRNWALCVALCGVVLFGGGLGNTAFAEVKIAIVDVQALLSESDAAKSIQDQLQAKRKEYQSDFDEIERKLKAKEEVLVKMRQDDPEKFEKERVSFEEEVVKTRKLVQNSRQELEKGALESMNELRKHILEIVSDMADEKGYNVVISQQNVVLAEKEYNITDEVMDVLNKKVKKISVKIQN